VDHIEPAGRPTAPWRADLTVEESDLAGLLQARAECIQRGSVAGLPWRDAVDLAAVQMGFGS
jgi:hypothetical protein